MWCDLWHFLHFWLDDHWLLKCPGFRQFKHNSFLFVMAILLFSGKLSSSLDAYSGCRPNLHMIHASVVVAAQDTCVGTESQLFAKSRLFSFCCCPQPGSTFIPSDARALNSRKWRKSWYVGTFLTSWVCLCHSNVVSRSLFSSRAEVINNS